APPPHSTPSLHDALPIYSPGEHEGPRDDHPGFLGEAPMRTRGIEAHELDIHRPWRILNSWNAWRATPPPLPRWAIANRMRISDPDRKSTRLNSSHVSISY